MLVMRLAIIVAGFLALSSVLAVPPLSTGTAIESSKEGVPIDADGHIYVIEDQGPDNSDIWQAVDLDGDAVAERMGRWLSNGAPGSEPTGLIFDPNVPKRAILAIQHPSSGNDALWQVTLGERSGQLRGN